MLSFTAVCGGDNGGSGRFDVVRNSIGGLNFPGCFDWSSFGVSAPPCYPSQFVTVLGGSEENLWRRCG